MPGKHRVLPAAENNFIQDASESGLFTDEEIRNLIDDLGTQYVSLESLTEQERLLNMTNDLIDRHAGMLQHYPTTFTYLTRRQAALTKHLEDQRERLTLKMAGNNDVDTHASLGSRMSKGSNVSRAAASRSAASSSGGDIPAFRSLNTPRMGGGLT